MYNIINVIITSSVCVIYTKDNINIMTINISDVKVHRAADHHLLVWGWAVCQVSVTW